MKNLSRLLSLAVCIAALCMNTAFGQTISSNEILDIKIMGVPASESARISSTYVVSPSGYLSMPMLPDGIKASGSSCAGVAVKIEAAYKKAGIYLDPRITVISNKAKKVQDESVNVVTVGGKVRSGGPKAYIKGMTIFKAIAAAGGAGTFGAINRVEYWHNGRMKLINMEKAANMNIPVYPGDSIKVPEKNAWGR